MKHKTIWTYKRIDNSPREKFLIIHEYEIDDATASEIGCFTFGIENDKMDEINYSDAETGAELIGKISLNAIKKGFIVEKLFDGVNTYIADENAEFEEDEKFWNNGK